MSYKIDVSRCQVLRGYMAMVLDKHGQIVQVFFATAPGEGWTAALQWTRRAEGVEL